MLSGKMSCGNPFCKNKKRKSLAAHTGRLAKDLRFFYPSIVPVFSWRGKQATYVPAGLLTPGSSTYRSFPPLKQLITIMGSGSMRYVSPVTAA